MSTNYKLIFYAPVAPLELVKRAIFAAGAGTYAKYTECAWQTLGQGQFRPADGARPAIGTVGTLEQTPEVRVEVLCIGEDVIRAAVAALKTTHPYEEPAYEVIRLERF